MIIFTHIGIKPRGKIISNSLGQNEREREWPEKTMLNDRDSNPPRSSTPRLCRRTFLCRGRVGSASAPSTTSSPQPPESWTRIKITPNLTALDSQRQ